MFRAIPIVLLLVAASASGEPFDAKPVADESLGGMAGKAGLSQAAFANNNATVANNRIIGSSTTGVISIDGSAFQNLNGLAVVNANTGNNVAINASLNVNVAITPR